MNKIRYIYLVLLLLPIVAVLFARPVCNFIHDNLLELVSFKFAHTIRFINSRYLVHVLFAFIAGFHFWKFRLKYLYMLFLILPLGITTILHGRHWFYYYQSRPVEARGDAHMPECYIESNYKDYWDYLTNGCHITVSDLTRWIITLTLVWILTILVTGIFFEVLKQRRKMRKHMEVLD